MHKVTKTFLELVQIASPSGHEQSMQNWITIWAKKHGWSIAVDKTGNVVVSKKAQKMLPFFLCAHMDTVQPGETIQPILDNAVIRSQGYTILGADNKASLAAMVTAIENWQQHSELGFELLFTVKEETGGGAEYLDTTLLSTKVGYIFDYAQPLGTIVTSAPYITNFTIRLEGQSSHACFPEKGRSVLPHLAKLISLIPSGKQLNEETYINIGKIQAGTSINTVPGVAEICGEVRSFEKASFEAWQTCLEQLALKLQTSELIISWETSGYCPGYVHNTQGEAFCFLQETLQKVGLNTRTEPTFGVSDGNSLNALGYTVITASDGVQLPHTTQECISIRDLEKLYEVMSQLITTGVSREENAGKR